MNEPFIAGLDVGAGRDPSILAIRCGNTFTEFLRFVEADVLKMSAQVDVALRDRGFQPQPRTAGIPADVPLDLQGGPPAGWDDGLPASSGLKALVVDRIGVGEGVCRWLQDKGWPVVRWHSSGKPRRRKDQERFQNQRAVVFWRLREAFERGTIAVPRHEGLAEELLAIRWHMNRQSGKIQIESKKELRSRLGRSPDYADAMALCFAVEGRTSGGGVMISF